MSTHDIPDNELDDFFKKSLEEPEIDFREEDWLQMEKKLDAANRQKSIFRRYLYSLLALLLLGISVSVVWWTNDGQPGSSYHGVVLPADSDAGNSSSAFYTPEAKSKVRNKSATPQAISGQPEVATSPDLNMPEEALATNKTPVAENKNRLISPQKGVAPEMSSQEQSGKEKVTGSSKSNKPVKERNSDVTAVGQQQEIVASTTQLPALRDGEPIGTENHTNSGIRTVRSTKKESSKRKNPQVRYTAGEKSLANAGNKPLKTPVAGNQPAVPDADQWIVTGTPMTEPSAEPASEYGFANNTDYTEVNWQVLPVARLPVKPFTEKYLPAEKYMEELKNSSPGKPANTKPSDSIEVKRLAKERIHYRYSVSVIVSPDISTVRPSGLTKPGTNIGILFNYRFRPKVSISTGLIRSTKIYDARIEDYSPPPGQWIYYIKPVEIKASCTVLDIPVNIRYTLLGRSTYSIYAVAGLSSYLMLSEHYRYIYDVDDSHLRKYWQVNNQNKHFFKVYNLSAGYERKLGKRISASAEPFLKIPGAGVGFGKIHLWSAGMFISANYQLGK